MKGSPTGCAALLAVPVGEHRAFFGDAVDVRRTVAHDSVVVGADIEPANIISPDDQYIWFSSHAVLPLIRNFFFEFENRNNRVRALPLLATYERFLY